LKRLFILIVSYFLMCASLYAEVTLDGTLGKSGGLSGPNYQIGADLGQQHGGNLFHSFGNFNLQSHESATFSGPDNVQNIIGRVTGGNPSNIDGTLRSTIPNADLYLLNPYGIVFGKNAKLDVQGGFHASTADYLRLQDGGRFDARTPNDSLLTIAPIAAFGFLTDSPAPITTQDSTLLVPLMKPLSLIGGDLHLQGTLPVQFDNSNTVARFAISFLHTTGGQLSLVAMGSSGEVSLNDDLILTGRGGEITLNRTLIDTSGLGSGNLKIRGERLEMQDSTLQTNTLGEFDGGTMDLQLTESLHVNSDQFYFPAIGSQTLGRGKGGSIAIKVLELTLSRTWIGAQTLGGGNNGNIDLEVTRLSLLEGANIASSAVGRMVGGQVIIKARESIFISGQNLGHRMINGIVSLIDAPSGISNYTYSTEEGSLGGAGIHLTTQRLDLVGGLIYSTSLGKGKASNVFIHADNVNLTEGGTITTSATEIGVAGNIQLDVTDTLSLSGRRVGTLFIPGNTDVRLENNQSSIHSVSLFGAGGQINLTAKNIHLTKEALISASSLGPSENAGNISLQAENLTLTDGAQINTSNGVYGGTTFFSGNGRGGDIRIQAKQLTLTGQPDFLQTGIFSDTYTRGRGGSLFVQTNSLDITRGAAISARSYNRGDAGQISLQAQRLQLSQHGSISTAATQAGGGNIDLIGLSELLYLENSEITTSVATGQGSGGNITIEQPQFVVLNQGRIVAQADAGRGGNIQIVADQFVTTPNSLVSASSNKGISGSVLISAPDNNIAGNLLTLSKEFKSIPNFSEFCKHKVFEEKSSFKVTRHRQSHPDQDDWQASPVHH